ncbi:MAG: molybdopterin converting factor small subunit [Crocinitomicaceae bacterium]
MKVETHYYGMISDRLERSSELHTFETEGSAVNLRDYFENRYPELKEINYKIAVNQEITDMLPANTEINEIALLPPFAGG